jgi:hypothetical protein
MSRYAALHTCLRNWHVYFDEAIGNLQDCDHLFGNGDRFDMVGEQYMYDYFLCILMLRSYEDIKLLHTGWSN